MKGFKKFLLQGNLVEIAVGLVIAVSFGTVVAKLDDFRPADLPVGALITALVAFVILAAVVYFGVVKPYTHLRERFMTEQEAEVEESVELLREIRDSLRAGRA